MKRLILAAAILMAAITTQAQAVDTMSTAQDSLQTDSAAYWNRWSNESRQARLDGRVATEEGVAKQMELGEVSVTATRRLVKNDIDKLTYDMAHDDEAKTKNTLDMLRKVPMVTVDGEDNIRVRGSSSFKIYKNGHPDPSLQGDNVSRLLKAIPANTIKRVEVITNPGAKYDAEGTTSILNIVTKDNANMQGVAGTVSMGANSKGDFQPNANITAQAGKLTMNLNYAFASMGKRSTESDGYSETTYKVGGDRLTASSHNEGPVKVHFGNLSASYEIDSLNFISLSGGGYFVRPDMDITQHTAHFDDTGSLDYGYAETTSLPKYNMYNFNGRMDFQHKTRLDGEVLTLSYMGVTTKQDQNTDHAFSDMSGVPFSYTGYEQRQHEKFFEHTAQVDYVRPFAKKHKLELGAKYINRSNKSNTTMDYEGDATADVNSRFKHTTQVAAAYAEWMATLGKWSLRAGLRYEYSHMRASYPDGSDTSFSKDLSDWCPSASVQYKFNALNTLSANYSTTINRPGIMFLNPARIETPTSIAEGAPGLNSARSQQVGLTFMHIGQKLTFNINPTFSFSNNQIAVVQGERNGKTWTSYGNVNHERRFYTSAFVQLNPWAKGSFSVNLGGGYQYYKAPNIGLDLSGWHGDYNVNYQQRLPWRLMFNAGVGGNFGREPGSVYGLDGKWTYHYFSLQRSFLKEDRLTVTLSTMSPFEHHSVYSARTVQGDYTGLMRSVRNNQRVGINVAWRFGSLRARVKTVDRSIQNDDMVGGIRSQGEANQQGGK